MSDTTIDDLTSALNLSRAYSERLRRENVALRKVHEAARDICEECDGEPKGSCETCALGVALRSASKVNTLG